MAEINTPAATAQSVTAVMEAIRNGASISAVCNVSKDQLENLYSLGYGLYNSANFQDAKTVFQALCIYDNLDDRFWMGLAGCRQALNDYQGAVDAYSMAGTVQAFASPEPFLHAARCLLKMNKKDDAVAVRKGVLELGDEKNPDHMKCRSAANALLELLAKQE